MLHVSHLEQPPAGGIVSPAIAGICYNGCDPWQQIHVYGCDMRGSEVAVNLLISDMLWCSFLRASANSATGIYRCSPISDKPLYLLMIMCFESSPSNNLCINKLLNG
ncbi:unnamed protein product, partial [Musa banksii]